MGEDEVAKLQRQTDQGGEVDDLEDVSRLGVDLKAWFPESDTQEEAAAAGVPTTRVTGRLDVSAALRDLARLMKRPEFQAQLGAQGIEAFGEREIRMLDGATTDPHFELHVGREDGKLRRLAASLKAKDPSDGASQAVILRFALELRNVDQPVSIPSPRGGRPIEELLQSQGSARAAARSAT